MFIIRDAENGNPIEEFDTIEQAETAVKEFYTEDAECGGAVDGFYEIYNDATGEAETYYCE